MDAGFSTIQKEKNKEKGTKTNECNFQKWSAYPTQNHVRVLLLEVAADFSEMPHFPWLKVTKIYVCAVRCDKSRLFANELDHNVGNRHAVCTDYLKVSQAQQQLSGPSQEEKDLSAQIARSLCLGHDIKFF
jgi:hypothetical protein